MYPASIEELIGLFTPFHQCPRTPSKVVSLASSGHQNNTDPGAGLAKRGRWCRALPSCQATLLELGTASIFSMVSQRRLKNGVSSSGTCVTTSENATDKYDKQKVKRSQKVANGSISNFSRQTPSKVANLAQSSHQLQHSRMALSFARDSTANSYRRPI